MNMIKILKLFVFVYLENFNIYKNKNVKMFNYKEQSFTKNQKPLNTKLYLKPFCTYIDVINADFSFNITLNSSHSRNGEQRTCFNESFCILYLNSERAKFNFLENSFTECNLKEFIRNKQNLSG